MIRTSQTTPNPENQNISYRNIIITSSQNSQVRFWLTLAPTCNSAQLEPGAKVRLLNRFVVVFCLLSFFYVSNHKYPTSALPRKRKFCKQPLITKIK